VECLIIFLRYKETSQHTAICRSVITVMKKADGPAAGQYFEEFKQGTGTLGKFKPEQAFTIPDGKATADKVSQV